MIGERNGVKRRQFLKTGVVLGAGAALFPGEAFGRVINQERVIDPSEIIFESDYVGKDPERESEAAEMLSRLWSAALNLGSPTLSRSADFFIRNSRVPSQKFDAIVDKGREIVSCHIDRRAPKFEVWDPTKANPEIPLALRYGVFPGMYTKDGGESYPSTGLQVVILVGEAEYSPDKNKIDPFTQFILLPRNFLAQTVLEMRNLVRQGITDTEGIKEAIGDKDSAFNATVRNLAWDRSFRDTQRAVQESPGLSFAGGNRFHIRYNEWLAIAETPGSTEEDRLQYTATIPYK